MAATRRRNVAGAAGQSVRNAMTVVGSAGSSHAPLVAHQSVNRAQSPAYARTVRGVSTRGPSLADSVDATRSKPKAGNSVAHQRGVLPRVDLEHHRGPVPGLSHD